MWFDLRVSRGTGEQKGKPFLSNPHTKLVSELDAAIKKAKEQYQGDAATIDAFWKFFKYYSPALVTFYRKRSSIFWYFPIECGMKRTLPGKAFPVWVLTRMGVGALRLAAALVQMGNGPVQRQQEQHPQPE